MFPFRPDLPHGEHPIVGPASDFHLSTARREASHMKVEKQVRGAVQVPVSQEIVRERCVKEQGQEEGHADASSRSIVVPPPPQTYSQQLKDSQTQIKKFSPREKLV